MKTALITGTSKGIGLETALAFGRSGHKVFATMRNTSMAEDFKQRIAAESLDISISEMDVDSDASVKKCVETIISTHGNIDVLVNNAGIERHGSVEELQMEDFKSVMETNYFGVLRCIKSVLPSMRKSQEGCIINISSVSGHISSSPLGAYAASKFALEALSEALAGEVKPFNIRVAIVEPGIINTQMASGISIDKESLYPHSKRLAGLFSASLKTPTPSTLVADKILEVAESGTWKLRHPVGPDAEPFIQWRKSMNDEQWVDWSACSDDDWYESVEQNFGLNAR
ncbi:SDR family oxidoreductase [Psychroflexus sediminis]|uniref:NADP-dependent 3-hydroxy acid dehydrogenase YdfG n=1 Tax=Psychroflexus sediminis TaxID=470826 RepID=A0A1G7X0G3_9FLAO|nr:SDR family oxidoreductase [Psychroflexus sediminis]SDG77688.1 NADP-dependent 3-hydroxy acid dehydrogenase YdfG [Psychroflexus sediminis]